MQLEKERDDIVQNLNATYQDTAIKRDEQYKNDVYHLNKQMDNKALNFKYLREIDYDLTKQIDMCVSKEKKKSKKNAKSDGINEWMMHRKVEEILLEVGSDQILDYGRACQSGYDLENPMVQQRITETNRVEEHFEQQTSGNHSKKQKIQVDNA